MGRALKMNWFDILKIDETTQKELTMTLIEYVLKKNNITNITPQLLSEVTI
jgi:hypothetical protein